MIGHGYNNDMSVETLAAICFGIIFFWITVYWLAYKILFRFCINIKKKWSKEMLVDDLNRNKVR